MQAVISSWQNLEKIIFKPENKTILLKTSLIVLTKLNYEILNIKVA